MCSHASTVTHLTDHIEGDLCQVLFHVHCCLSISLRPDPIQQLVTTLIEGGKKSLQIATVKINSSIIKEFYIIWQNANRFLLLVVTCIGQDSILHSRLLPYQCFIQR